MVMVFSKFLLLFLCPLCVCVLCLSALCVWIFLIYRINSFIMVVLYIYDGIFLIGFVIMDFSNAILLTCLMKRS